MAELQQEESRKVQYPLDSKCYKILDEIGRGESATVHKAICVPNNSSVVAIKCIDLGQSKADFDNVRREAQTVSLLSHPNILEAHCSFIVDRSLWVVMPFMSAGSLQSIITSSFPDGLPEPCIAIILKETLCALSYLHDQGHLHGDVKAGNILMDSNGAVKLADFGVSASIYESTSSSLGSSSLKLTDVAEKPYWMAPEIIHSHTGYGFKADIWSFGITAMELAHGRPPLSHLPPSKFLFMKMTKQFRFSDYEKTNVNSKKKNFSEYFKEMIGLCLDQDPSKRPSAHKLLKHSFFSHCKGPDFLAKHVLQGLPSVENRYKLSKLERVGTSGKNDEEDSTGEIINQRRIIGWNFNVEDFELNPVFPTETEDQRHPPVVKKIRFGGVTIIPDRGGDSEASSGSTSGQIEPEIQLPGQVSDGSNNMGQQIAASDAGNLVQETVLNILLSLNKNLDERRSMLKKIDAWARGESSSEMSREEELMQEIEKLKTELEVEKKKNSDLEEELKLLMEDEKNKNSGLEEHLDFLRWLGKY